MDSSTLGNAIEVIFQVLDWHCSYVGECPYSSDLQAEVVKGEVRMRER